MSVAGREHQALPGLQERQDIEVYLVSDAPGVRLEEPSAGVHLVHAHLALVLAVAPGEH